MILAPLRDIDHVLGVILAPFRNGRQAEECLAVADVRQVAQYIDKSLSVTTLLTSTHATHSVEVCSPGGGVVIFVTFGLRLTAIIQCKI